MARRKKATQPTPKEVHNILPGLLPLKEVIGTLTLDPDNARGHDEANIESIVASLKEFGQRKCIVVKKDGMVVSAGNGTLMAAKRLGWTHIAALVVDDDEFTAKAYALADNRTGELANWDYDALITRFNELQSAGYNVGRLGWNEQELNMLTQSSFTPDAVSALPDSGDGGGTKDPSFTKDEFKQLLAVYHRHHTEGEGLGEFVMRAVGAMVSE